jgi:hypothetical protein
MVSHRTTAGDDNAGRDASIAAHTGSSAAGPGTPSHERERARRLERSVGRLSPDDLRADDAEFGRGLAAVTAYAGRHGHTLIPDGYRDDSGFPLAAWVARARLDHLEGLLEPARCAALEKIDGWTWPRVD